MSDQREAGREVALNHLYAYTSLNHQSIDYIIINYISYKHIALMATIDAFLSTKEYHFS